MRNMIFTLAIALIAGCGSGGSAGGQLQVDWAPTATYIGIIGFEQPTVDGQPSLDELKTALALEFDRLGVDPTKATSSAPMGKGVEVADLGLDYAPDDETGFMVLTLDWTERLAGDCDFNGEVNLSDLQPLVLYWENTARYKSFYSSKGIAGFPDYNPHFTSENQAGYAKNWVLCQIDSDNNGVINLSDLSGIATHYQQSLGGYNVYRRKAGEASFTRLPNPGNPAAKMSYSRDQAYQPGTANQVLARPQRYSFVDADMTDGMREYYVIATDADGNEGEADPYVLSYFLNNSFNNLPSAQLRINDEDGVYLTEPSIAYFETGSKIELDPSNSAARQADVTIVKYAFDVNGDGQDDIFQTHDLPRLITLNDEGVFLIRLSVTDSNGLMAFHEKPIYVGENHPTTVEMQIDTGDGFVPTQVRFTSFGTIDRDTIVSTVFAFWKFGDENQKHTNRYATIHEPGDYSCRITVTDMFGNQSSLVKSFNLSEGGYNNPGWRFTEVNESTVGAISAEIIDGKPALVFSGNADGEWGLCFKQAADQAGLDWGENHQVAVNTWDSIIFPPLLREVDGIPMVAFYEGTLQGKTSYSHAMSAEGIEWMEPIEFAQGGFTMPAMGISNGRPVLATGGYFGIDVFSALDPLGDTWSETQQIEGQYGMVIDWVNVNGKEGLVLSAGSPSSLVLRNQDTDDPWEEAIALPEGAGEFFQPYAVCDGMLTFWKGSESLGIEQFQASVADATTWGEPSLIDIPIRIQMGGFDVLLIDGAPPWLCVYDTSHFELQIMQATDLRASAWGEPEVITSFGDVGSGCKLIEIDGQPAVVYNDRTSDKLMLAVRE